MLLPHFTVQCEHFIPQFISTNMQRMYIFTPANSDVQAVNSIRKDGQSSWRKAASQCRTIALPENFTYLTYLKHLGEFYATHLAWQIYMACKGMPFMTNR